MHPHCGTGHTPRGGSWLGDTQAPRGWPRGLSHRPQPHPALVRPPSLCTPSLQVGAIGDEEEWVSLYEEESEPDAQTLEIPNLTPYTHYR